MYKANEQSGPNKVNNYKNNNRSWKDSNWNKNVNYVSNHGSHVSFRCDKKMTVEERTKIVKEERRCFLCFKGHSVKECRSRYTCRNCGKKHSHLLCSKPQSKVNYVKEESEDESQEDEMDISDQEEDSCEFAGVDSIYHVTSKGGKQTPKKRTPPVEVPIRFQGIKSDEKMRIQLDTGADVSILNPNLVKKLKIKTTPSTQRFKAVSHIGKFAGTVDLVTKIGKIEDKVTFLIPDDKTTPSLLGREDMLRFNLKIGEQLKVSRKASTDKDPLHFFASTTLEDNDQSIKELLNKYQEIVPSHKYDVGTFKSEEFELPLTSDVPITLRPYRCPRVSQKIIEEHFTQLLKSGVIEKAASPYAPPVVLVDKANGEKRMCIDFRKLNDVTQLDRFPIARIEDLQDALLNKSVFTTLDLASGFWQIKIKKEDKPKTAFVTHNSHYQWQRMPFGLKNAPVFFQRAIQQMILKHDLSQFTGNYIDYFIVFSENRTDHLHHLAKVFNAIKKEGLKIQPEKCKFLSDHAIYLGYRISLNKLEPIINNIEAILKVEPPKKANEVGSFLGKVNYYHKFFPLRATLSQPPHHPAKQDA